MYVNFLKLPYSTDNLKSYLKQKKTFFHKFSSKLLLETVAKTKVYEPFNEYIKQLDISLSDFNRWMIQILISGVEKSSDD